MSEFDAHKVLEEANERAEAHRNSPRWVPIAAAVMAVIAAITSLIATQHSTQSLVTKNEAIIAFTRASDQYNYYQAKAIKEELYRAAQIAGHRPDPLLQRTIDKEHKGKAKPLAAARTFEEEGQQRNRESERYLHSYETLEIAVTMFEIAIVMISISALATTRILTVVAITATLAGLIFAVKGLTVG